MSWKYKHILVALLLIFFSIFPEFPCIRVSCHFRRFSQDFSSNTFAHSIWSDKGIDTLNNDLLLETNEKCKDCCIHQLGRPLAKFLEKWEVTSATFSISTVLHPDSGIVINKLFKIFIETKKSNFYVKNEGLGLLKCHKSRSFRGALPPWTPQQRRCSCTPPGTCGPLDPWLFLLLLEQSHLWKICLK